MPKLPSRWSRVSADVWWSDKGKDIGLLLLGRVSSPEYRALNNKCQMRCGQHACIAYAKPEPDYVMFTFVHVRAE